VGLRHLFIVYRTRKLKDDFILSASHDMKTPLTSIRMYAETLFEGKVSDEVKVQHYLKTIIEKTDLLSNYINNILDFSKISHGQVKFQFEPMLISDLLNQIQESFQAIYPENKLNISFDEKLTGEYAAVDNVYFIRAILNLLINAQNYSSKDKIIDLKCQKSDSLWILIVQDYGEGIAKSELKKIFKKYYRSKYQKNKLGTGLGLYIVDKIISAHQGKIILESEVGKGSRFTVEMELNK